MTTHQRPLSPHLQVYRWQITMLMSIAHRASGVLLSLGALGLVGWLLALAAGPAAYEQWRAMAASLPGQIGFFAPSAALVYQDRKSVVEGKSVSVRVNLGGGR